MHPLLTLLATQPQLLADHAEAYAELLATEIDQVSTDWKRQALLTAAALGSLVVAALLAGVALLLWAVVAHDQMPAPWLLIAVPLAPLAVALWCRIAARTAVDRKAFSTVKQQLQADVAMLREAARA